VYSDFNKNYLYMRVITKTCGSTMPYSDKDRQRRFQREYLQKKKEDNPKWNAELNKRRKQKRDNIHEIVNHIKRNTGCLFCDENDPYKLQFHHLIPEFKVDTIAQLISRRSKLVVVLKEIDKCVCVCTACHKLLQNNVDFIKKTIMKEKWHKDWGLQEALDWSNFHPQNRIKKSNYIEVLKAVVRNLQIQDPKKFENLRIY